VILIDDNQKDFVTGLKCLLRYTGHQDVDANMLESARNHLKELLTAIGGDRQNYLR
jgi:hypothetical protein